MQKIKFLLNPNFLFLLFSFCLFYAFAVDKHLSADGAYMFMHVLEHQKFNTFELYRMVTHYITEWPVVLAVIAGCKNVQLLSLLFGFGIYLPFLCSYVLVSQILKSCADNYLLKMLFVFSLFAVNLSADYILVAGSHYLAIFSWPLLFLMLKSHSLTFWESCILVILLLMFPFLYDAAVVVYLLLCALSLWSIISFRSLPGGFTRYLMAALSLFGFLVSLYFVSHPENEANRGSFIISVLSGICKNFYVLFVIIGAVTCILSGRSKKLAVLILISSMLFVLLVFHVFNVPVVLAKSSFASRSLTVTILPLLLVMASAVVLCRNKAAAIIKMLRCNSPAFMVLFLLMTALNLHSTYVWHDYKKSMVYFVASHSGYYGVGDTPLYNSSVRWTWNNPLLSVIWSYPLVSCIILNPEDVVWQPYNPKIEFPLKRYVSYSPSLLADSK